MTRESVTTGYQSFNAIMAMERFRPSTEQLTMRESRVQISISKVDDRKLLGSARSTCESPNDVLAELNGQKKSLKLKEPLIDLRVSQNILDEEY